MYHGEEPLCPVVQTNDVKASSPVWHEQVKFDIDVADIPRMTRLCIALYDKRRTKKGKKVFSFFKSTQSFVCYTRLYQEHLQAFLLRPCVLVNLN